MANNSDTKNSKAWIYILAGLVVLGAITGGWFYQSKQSTEAENVKAEPVAANSEQKPKSTVPVKKQEKSEKKESGSVMDKLKNVEVYGAKNPCTETQRMMKQCSD